MMYRLLSKKVRERIRVITRRAWIERSGVTAIRLSSKRSISQRRNNSFRRGWRG